MNCHDVRELLAAYALDALTADEHAAVRAHLETCALHPELASLRAVTAALGGTADPLTPPVALRARVLAIAAPAPSDLATPPASRQPRALPPFARIPRWAIAAVFAALAFLLGTWIPPQRAPESALVRREAPAADGPSHGRVVYVPEAQLLALEVDGLSPAPVARTYQLWLVRGATLVSLGVFETTPNGRGTIAARTAFAAGDAVAVTLEPVGGSPAPTAAPFLVVQYD